MAWHGLGHGLGSWEPWREMRRLQREVDRLFGEHSPRARTREFPLVNVWADGEKIVVTAEVAGVSPGDIEISVLADSWTLSGKRAATELREGEAYHRQERAHGNFSRVVSLPFRVDGDSVEATCKDGVLEVTMERAATDKPRRIAVKNA